jgi:hypothetical protein
MIDRHAWIFGKEKMGGLRMRDLPCYFCKGLGAEGVESVNACHAVCLVARREDYEMR